jgi:hypothetical protein
MLRIDDYGERLLVTTGLTAVLWVVVMLATPPESAQVLERFVKQVRPSGPGWRRWRERTGVEPQETLLDLLAQLAFSCAVLFGALLGLGGFLLKLPLWGWGGLVTAVLGTLALRQLPQLQAGVRRALGQTPQG